MSDWLDETARFTNFHSLILGIIVFRIVVFGMEPSPWKVVRDLFRPTREDTHESTS